VNAEFNWWLLIVGLVIGAGLVWLILADGSRRDADVAAGERAGEARWIAEELRRVGRNVPDQDVEDVLDLHAAYLAGPPPDEPAVASTPAPVPDAPRVVDPTVDAATDEGWPAPTPTGGATLPRRSTIAQPAGQPRGDGDGLPV